MPDALSKTIPIWCAVINRFLFPTESQHHKLYTPPQVVSKSENAQIEALLPTFLQALQALNLPLTELKAKVEKPLRPIWVTPETELLDTGIVFDEWHPVICCTASRRVVGGEMSEGGYIQGAGDDTENWACGLTPTVFWANKDVLMATPECDLQDVIGDLVAEAEKLGGERFRQVLPCTRLFVGPLYVVATGTNSVITVTLLPKVTDKSTWLTSPTRMDIGIGHTKIGSRNLRTALPSIIDFLTAALSSSSTRGWPIIVACETGKDLSIGVALAILCLFCDEKGELQERRSERVDKDFIRERISWMSTALPDAIPMRATLQSVNAFLMQR